MKAVQSVVYALFKVNIFANASASSYASMASSAKKAKEETKQLLGIHDEINNIQNNDNSDSGSGNGTPSPSFDLSTVDMSGGILDAIKNGNWYEVGAALGNKLNEAMASIHWDKIQNSARDIARNIANFLNGFIDTTNWYKVGNTFAQGLNTIIYFGYEFVTTFNWIKFGQAIGDSINGFFQNVKWDIAGQTLSKGIQGILDTAIEAVKTVKWGDVGKSIITLLSNIETKEILEKLKTLLSEVGIGLAELLWGVIKASWDDFTKDGWEGMWKKIQEISGTNLDITDDIIKARNE